MVKTPYKNYVRPRGCGRTRGPRGRSFCRSIGDDRPSPSDDEGMRVVLTRSRTDSLKLNHHFLLNINVTVLQSSAWEGSNSELKRSNLSCVRTKYFFCGEKDKVKQRRLLRCPTRFVLRQTGDPWCQHIGGSGSFDYTTVHGRPFTDPWVLCRGGGNRWPDEPRLGRDPQTRGPPTGVRI